MKKRRRGKQGLSLGGIIALIIILNLITEFGWLLSLLFSALPLIVLFIFLRVIIKGAKGSEARKKDPVDVKANGTYQGATGKSSATAAYEPVVRPQPQPKKEPVYPPEVQAVIDEGKRAHSELERLYATIPDLAVKAKIRELIEVSDKIVEDIKDDPSDVPQIKQFLDYYLPTTIKLLNAYDRMSAQGIEGDNISGAMQNIEEMLDTSIAAYKKLLDSLFANQALDVETDIEVMNTLLKREGLAGNGSAGFGKATKEDKQA